MQGEINRKISLAYTWTVKIVARAPTISLRNTAFKYTIHEEISVFFGDVMGKSLNEKEIRSYWSTVQKTDKQSRLGRLARLFMTANASAIP